MRIALLGMGRLGRSIAPLLQEAAHEVLPWRRGEPIPTADVAWILVPDDAVPEVAHLVQPGPVVLHASARLDLTCLEGHHPAGSLHPVQTFPGPEHGTPPLQGAAAAVAGDAEAIEVASAIARSLGMVPVRVPGDRRLYHAACVLAGNLVTPILGAAREAAMAAGVPSEAVPDLLVPLALSAVHHALAWGAAEALTGPWPRGDAAAVRAHREALASMAPGALPIYEAAGRLVSPLVPQHQQRMEEALSCPVPCPPPGAPASRRDGETP